MLLSVLSLAIVLAADVRTASSQSSVLSNPTKKTYANELLRLLTPAAGPTGSFMVAEDGTEVPYQVEEIGGQSWIWLCSTFESGASHRYEVKAGRPKPSVPKVIVRKEGEWYVLDNGQVAVRLPATAGKDILGPIAGLRLADGKWVGGSFWHTEFRLRKFTATVVGDGTILGKVRLRYEFDGLAGLWGDVPAFAEIDVALGPGWSHVEIFERHQMARDDYWEMEASKGWSPRQGVSKPFGGGAGSGEVSGKVEPNRALRPGGLPLNREDLFLRLFPRWNQHYRDGWYFAATDGNAYVGAVVVGASRWVWPHQNAIEAVVKPSGDYAGLRCSTWKGERLWWLLGPTLAAADTGYVARYAWEGLDKLNHNFILEWPGQRGGFAGMNFYSGNDMNPTGPLRGQGRQAMANAGKPGDLGTLLRVQVMMHTDAYGSYWNYWSPENPNFFTDFTKVPIAMTANLKAHPRFQELCRTAEQKLREDMYHSVTLPGGAGQECPGYVDYALGHWREMAKVCKQHLGFDLTTWDRFKAAEYFQKRISQPDGKLRRMNPLGDTHPAKDGGAKIVDVSADEVRKFVTEELPGFGAIFTNQPGTPQETYLAFKSGPNRGHYHGDQLSFHYCANARPVAVDHHCSYHPRAGQEHMHNRVAFHTEKLPYANMDGYERLIALKTSPQCDIAVGQVESDRLRHVQKLPPELWHEEYPQHALARPLVYRRTVVLVKGRPQDYFVLRDQYWAPEPLGATFCLHVLSDSVRRDDRTVDFGNLTLYCAHPEQFKFESFPWSHDNGGREATQGARLTIRAPQGEFITVLYPGKPPAIRPVPGGVQVGSDEILFSGDKPTAGDSAAYVTVKRAGREVLSLAGKDINLDRSQGDVGLFVPDAGYPFGEIPDWLIRQRSAVPEWAPAAARELRRYELRSSQSGSK